MGLPMPALNARMVVVRSPFRKRESVEDVHPVLGGPQGYGLKEAHPGHEAADDDDEEGQGREHGDEQDDESEDHPPPASDVDEARPELAGDGGVVASTHDPALHGEDDRDDDHGEAGEDDGVAVLRDELGRLVEDEGGVDEEAPACAQDPLGLEPAEDAEQLERGDEDHGRDHDRQRHLEDGAELGRACDARRLFQRLVHVAERRREQDDEVGDAVRLELGPDDAPEAVDVERAFLDEREQLERRVDHADVRVEQHDPADGIREAREDEGDPEEVLESVRPGDMGSGEDQGYGDREWEAEDEVEEPEDERVPYRLEDTRVLERLDPVVEAPDDGRNEEVVRNVEAENEQEDNGEHEVEAEHEDGDSHDHRAGLRPQP